MSYFVLSFVILLFLYLLVNIEYFDIDKLEQTNFSKAFAKYLSAFVPFSQHKTCYPKRTYKEGAKLCVLYPNITIIIVQLIKTTTIKTKLFMRKRMGGQSCMDM